MSVRVVWSWIASFALVASSSALAQDRIIQKDGKTIPAAGAQQKIQVTEEGIQQVAYKIVGVPAAQGIQTSKVERVEYGEKSPDYDAALQSIRHGDFADAVEKLTKLSEASEPAWVKPYALFQIGEAYRTSGDFDKAIAAYNKLATAQPKSRFVPEAKLDVAICQVNKKDAEGAKVTLQKFKEEAASKGYDPTWINRAAYWEVRMVESGGGFPEAITRYNELAAKVEKDDPSLAAECRLRIGMCYSLQKDFKKALDFYQAILENGAASKEMLAGAHLGKGLAHFNLKEFPQAQLECLRVIVLNDEGDADIPDETIATSMVYAAQCFDLLKADQPEGPARAQRLYREVVRDYPGTQAAAQAKSRVR
jgi:TolA-binding protein